MPPSYNTIAFLMCKSLNPRGNVIKEYGKEALKSKTLYILDQRLSFSQMGKKGYVLIRTDKQIDAYSLHLFFQNIILNACTLRGESRMALLRVLAQQKA